MKLTNKFIDKVFRLILYTLPFAIGFYLMVVYKQAGADGYTALNTWFSDFNGYFSNIPIWSGFMTWINENLTYNVVLFNYLFNYAFYLVIVEFAVLFKNVLVYLFKVANGFLEKGVNMGD